MIPVILESPYAAQPGMSVEDHILYARCAMLDCLDRGEAPMVSHLLYTQVLDDLEPDQRKRGIEAGLAWRIRSVKAVFYANYGISNGMKGAMEVYAGEGFAFDIRSIDRGRLAELKRRVALADQAIASRRIHA